MEKQQSMGFVLLLVLLGSALAACATPYRIDGLGQPGRYRAEPDLTTSGWRALFDGESLSGWKPVNGTAHYDVEDRCIVGRCDPAARLNSFLRTEESFSDFVFTCDVKFDVPGNSGIQIRSHQRAPGEGAPDGRVYGYQCELDSSERKWTAGIYDEARRGWLHDLEADRFAAAREAFHPMEWNRITIRALGNRLETWVNGVPVADYIDEDPDNVTLEGFIALQVHAAKEGQVRWRDLRVYPLAGRPDA